MNKKEYEIQSLDKSDKILMIGEYGRLVKYLTGVIRDLKKDKESVVPKNHYIQVAIPLAIEENKTPTTLDGIFGVGEPTDIHKFGIRKDYQEDFIDWLIAYHEQLLTRYKDKIEKIAKLI